MADTAKLDTRLGVQVSRDMMDRLRRLAADESARRGRPVSVGQVVRETIQARLRRRKRRRLTEDEEDELLARAAEEAYYDPENQRRIPWEQVKAESERLA